MMDAPPLIVTILGVVCSVALWIVLCGIGLLIAVIREWVDDYENKYPNPVLYIVGRCQGWGYSENLRNPYTCETKSPHDGGVFVLQGIVTTFVISLLGFVGYYQLAITVSIVVVVALLFLIRFVKRLNKKLEQHTKDKKAHE